MKKGASIGKCGGPFKTVNRGIVALCGSKGCSGASDGEKAWKKKLQKMLQERYWIKGGRGYKNQWSKHERKRVFDR